MTSANVNGSEVAAPLSEGCPGMEIGMSSPTTIMHSRIHTRGSPARWRSCSRPISAEASTSRPAPATVVVTMYSQRGVLERGPMSLVSVGCFIRGPSSGDRARVRVRAGPEQSVPHHGVGSRTLVQGARLVSTSRHLDRNSCCLRPNLDDGCPPYAPSSPSVAQRKRNVKTAGRGLSQCRGPSPGGAPERGPGSANTPPNQGHPGPIVWPPLGGTCSTCRVSALIGRVDPHGLGRVGPLPQQHVEAL